MATREGEAMAEDSPGGCPLCHGSLLVRCDGAECPVAPHEVHLMPCTDPFGVHDRGGPRDD